MTYASKAYEIIRLVASNMLVLILLCLSVELGFRMLCYVTGQGFFRDSQFTSPWFVTYDPPPPTENDQAFGFFRHRAAPVYKAKEENTFRIIAVGGSTTANERPWRAGGVDYPSTLENLLNAKSSKTRYEVLNAGADAYSTAHSLVNIAFRLVEYHPDLIILMENMNDSSVIGFQSGPTSDYGNKYLLPFYINPVLQGSLSVQGLLFQSRLLCFLHLPQLIADKTRVINFDNLDNSAYKGLWLFRRNLRSISAICRIHDIRLLLLTQPHQDQDHRYVKLHIVKQYNRAVLQEAEHLGVYAFDMASELGSRSELFCDMIHYSPDGIRRFAALLAPVVLNIRRQNQNAHQAVDPEYPR